MNSIRVGWVVSPHFLPVGLPLERYSSHLTLALTLTSSRTVPLLLTVAASLQPGALSGSSGEAPSTLNHGFVYICCSAYVICQGVPQAKPKLWVTTQK